MYRVAGQRKDSIPRTFRSMAEAHIDIYSPHVQPGGRSTTHVTRQLTVSASVVQLFGPFSKKCQTKIFCRLSILNIIDKTDILK